jgi:hypothetical protein
LGGRSGGRPLNVGGRIEAADGEGQAARGAAVLEDRRTTSAMANFDFRQIARIIPGPLNGAHGKPTNRQGQDAAHRRIAAQRDAMTLQASVAVTEALYWARDASGYVASLLVLTTFCMKSMQWLRLTAIASNVAFIGYALVADIRPVFILHCILLPVNLFRLLQIYRARLAARRLLGEPEIDARGLALGRPRFLSDDCLADPGTALRLVEREQARVVDLLPACFPSEAATASGIELDAARRAVTQLLDEIERFLAILQTKDPSEEELKHISNLRSRDEMLRFVHLALAELEQLLPNRTEDQEYDIAFMISEALATLLLCTGEAARSPEPREIDLLLGMTGDRSQLVENIRQRSVASMTDRHVTDSRSIYAITSLYERVVWLLHRYAALLGYRADAFMDSARSAPRSAPRSPARYPIAETREQRSGHDSPREPAIQSKGAVSSFSDGRYQYPISEKRES